MKFLRDNSVWFRHRVATRRHRRPWLSLLVHPAFVLVPGMVLEVWMGTHPCACNSPGDLFFLTGFLQVFYFAVRGLTATVGSVSREKERRTFESLQGTGVSPREVVLGHFAAALAPRLPDLLVWSPCILLLYPGIGVVKWLELMAVTVAVLVGFAACGMAASMAGRSTLAAGQMAFGALVGSFFGTFWFDLVVQQATGANGLPWLSIPFNPLLSVAGLLSPGCSTWGSFWIALVGVYLVLTAGLLWFATSRLGSPATGRAGRTRSGRPLRLAWLGENPVLFRELRLERPWIYLVVVLTPMVALPMLPGHAGNLELGCDVAIFLHLLYFCFKAVSRSVGAIASEREQRTLESLVATRLSGADLYRGKLLAAVLPLLLEMAAFSPVLLSMSGLGVMSIAQALGLELITVVTVVCLASLGLWASARFSSSARAAQVVLSVVVLAFVASVVVDMMFSDGHMVASAASPLMAFGTLLWKPHAVQVWLGCPLLYAASALVLSRCTGRRLERMVG